MEKSNEQVLLAMWVLSWDIVNICTGAPSITEGSVFFCQWVLIADSFLVMGGSLLVFPVSQNEYQDIFVDFLSLIDWDFFSLIGLLFTLFICFCSFCVSLMLVLLLSVLKNEKEHAEWNWGRRKHDQNIMYRNLFPLKREGRIDNWRRFS